MRYLSLGELVDLHRAIIEQSGGAAGIRDLGLLESGWRNRARRSVASISIRRSFTKLQPSAIRWR
jgi:hypothetical protein